MLRLALVTLLAAGTAGGPALAQDQTEAGPQAVRGEGATGAGSAAAPGAAIPRAIFSNMGTGSGGGAAEGPAFVAAEENVVLASALIGQEVRHLDGTTPLGRLGDLILGADGQVLGFVLETEGKAVAVDPEELVWLRRADGSVGLAMNAAAGRLDRAPAFDAAALRAAGAGRSGADPRTDLTKAPVASAEGQASESPAGLRGADGVVDGTRPLDAPPETLDGQTADDTLAPRQIESPSQLAAPGGLVDPAQAQALVGAPVYGAAEDEAIGAVREVLTGPDGQVAGVVVDVGGHLGMGGHAVAMAIDAVEILAPPDGAVVLRVDADEERLRALPAYDPAAWERGDPGAALGRD